MASAEIVHSKTFSALKYLSLNEISMEGDQCCWKRLVSKNFQYLVPSERKYSGEGCAGSGGIDTPEYQND